MSSSPDSATSNGRREGREGTDGRGKVEIQVDSGHLEFDFNLILDTLCKSMWYSSALSSARPGDRYIVAAAHGRKGEGYNSDEFDLIYSGYSHGVRIG